MHDARAVANFFIDRALGTGRPVTLMTLLKVLYFSHAWQLAKTDEPLVGQPFEAWRHGPVNRVVYEQMKGQGSKPITKRLVSFNVQKGCFTDAEYDFDEGLEMLLANVFDYYSQFHAFHLSDLTHEKGSPWDIIWTKAERQSVPGMVIPNDLIKKWFRESSERQSQSIT